MSAFTVKERKRFRLWKYVREKAFEYLLKLGGCILLTELAVYLCGGRNYIMAAVLASGYALGGAIYDICHYKKEWLDVDIRPEDSEKTES